jgi:hypothetical protein
MLIKLITAAVALAACGGGRSRADVAPASLALVAQGIVFATQRHPPQRG